MLHPQAEEALALWAQGPRVTDPDFDIGEQRRLARELALAEEREPVARVLDVDADGVPCRLLAPEEPRGTIVFLHGGGFVFGDLETHDAHSRRMANRTGFAVLAVDYRKPPEHRFPAAPDDVDTAVRWLRANAEPLGLDPGRLVALGDSAGGNLALVAALRNPGAFAATVLVYPFIDPTQRFDSYRREAGGLGAVEAGWYWERYAASPEDLTHPDLAPLDSDVLGLLPPTLVQAAEHDPLVDEDVELARRLRAAGVPTELTTYAGMVHGFWRQPAMFDAADEALEEIVGFLRRTVPAPSGRRPEPHR
jgi:acetyl esterase